VHKLAEAKYRDWKDQEEKDMLEKARQRHHFESTWRTGEIVFLGGGASPPPWHYIFSNYSFLVPHPVNRDDQYLLARAMASDFTVAWQFSQRDQLFFDMDQTPHPYPTRSLVSAHVGTYIHTETLLLFPFKTFWAHRQSFFLFKSKMYHPITWWDSISRPIAPQAKTLPLDHAAGATKT
jgi:hypothetical protein